MRSKEMRGGGKFSVRCGTCTLYDLCTVVFVMEMLAMRETQRAVQGHGKEAKLVKNGQVVSVRLCEQRGWYGSCWARWIAVE